MAAILKIIQLWRHFPAILQLLIKRGTPLKARLLIVFAIVYAFLPYDLIPEWLPGYGLIDDVLIVTGLMYLAQKISGPEK